MKSLWNLIIYKCILLYSKLRFMDDWCFKTFLQNNADIKNFDLWNAAYDSRLRKYGSWIGFNAKFTNKPFFPHGIVGIFISGSATIGKNAVIFQQVTIGSNTLFGHSKMGAPTIGDNVYIGAGAKIIGKIRVGNNCRIGANAVVVSDVPDNTVVVSTMRLISKENTLDNRFFRHGSKGWEYYDFDSRSFLRI